MSNYNSSYTGAQLDTAIGRVIDGGSLKTQVDTNTTDISDLKGRMTTAEGDIDTVEASVTSLGTRTTALETEVNDLNYEEVLKSSKFATATSGLYPGTSLYMHTDNSHTNAAYRGKPVIGITVNMYESGTLQVKKCTVEDDAVTTTDIGSFSVVTGPNKLIFQSPVTCDETEFIGFTGKMAKYASTGGGGTKFMYWNGSSLIETSGSISMSILLDSSINERVGDLEAAMEDCVTEEDIAGLQASVDALNMQEIMTSPYIDTGTGPQSAGVYRFFCGYSSGYTNSPYKGKSIIGMRLKSNASGSLMVGIGHNIYSNSTEYSVEDAFESSLPIPSGLSTVMFPSPIVITGDKDMIAFKTTTAKLLSKATNGSIAFMYVDTATSKIKGSRTQLSVALIISDPITNRVSVLEEQMAGIGDVAQYGTRITACETANALQDRKLRMLNPAYIEQPYFYHWNPNDFIPQGGQSKGIPSQSIEDNFLAKRLGFAMVEANIQETADGEYVVTHGISGKLGAEFPSEYQDLEFSSLTLAELKEINYDSYYKCYQHPVPTADEFFRNCAQLGLGVNIRDNSAAIVAIARKYLPDNMFSISAGATVRTNLNFAGMIGYYVSINSTTLASDVVCNIEYLRNIANTYGGAPFHISLHGSHIDYMIANDTLDTIVPTLRSEGIYIGAAYVSHKSADRLVAVGGVGIASDAWQCNIFDDANVGAWSLVDSSLTGWTIPSGVTVDGGTITNSSNANIDIVTPSTGSLALAKGCVQARVTGTVKFAIGGSYNTYSDYTIDVPVSFAKGKMGTDMQLTVTIYPNSTLEFLTYKVSKC